MIARLQSRIARVRSPIARLQSRIARLQSPIARVHSPIACLHSPIACLHSPIARLHGLIARLHGLIAILHGLSAFVHDKAVSAEAVSTPSHGRAPEGSQARLLLRARRMKVLLLLLAAALPVLADDTTPAKPWATNIGAGLAITSGNTDTKSLNFSFATKYDPHTRFVFKADALYLRGESNGVVQVDKATADAREEYALSDRTFTFAEVSYLRDVFKDINYLVAPLVGGGYRLIKTDRENLTVDGAGGAQFESDTGAGKSSSGAVKAGENFD